jgi:hypothetical protein
MEIFHDATAIIGHHAFACCNTKNHTIDRVGQVELMDKRRDSGPGKFKHHDIVPLEKCNFSKYQFLCRMYTLREFHPHGWQKFGCLARE